MPSQKAFFYFLTTLGAGLFFMMIAFTMFLPVLVLAPQKFALCFTIGSLLVMSSFFVLKGPMAQLNHMITPEVNSMLPLSFLILMFETSPQIHQYCVCFQRLPFTLIFASSIFATIYVSMAMHSYLLSLVCSGFQVSAFIPDLRPCIHYPISVQSSCLISFPCSFRLLLYCTTSYPTSLEVLLG